MIGKSTKNWGHFAFGPLPPVIFNALIIGAELTIIYMNTYSLSVFLVNIGFVFLGEVVVCYVLGIPLIAFLKKNSVYKKIFK
jgi:uncharacterized membrane protein